MTKITWKPGTMLSPLPPVLVSCGTIDKPNVMTVAWTGIICSDPVLTYVSIRPSRFSYDIIKQSGEFVINIPIWKMASAVDYCGVRSGRNVDKFQETGLTAVGCSQISAPQIKECPLSVECRVKSVTPYGTHDMFLAEVLAVNVDDAYIDEKGGLDLEKAGILAFAHGKYYTLGRNVGSFGFSVNKAVLKQKQKMAQVEVIEKQTPRKALETKNKNPHSRVPHGSQFGVRRNKKGRGNDRDERRADVVKDIISRPNKRYDKVRKVKTEHLGKR